MRKTKKLIFLGLMIAYSLILHLVESTMPGLHFIAPGAKLGLTNIITVVLLYSVSRKEAFTVLLMRILLGSVFAGSFSSFLYSLSGGVFSFMTMVLMQNLEKYEISILGVSVMGALAFNIGQLIMAGLIIRNMSIIVYFPAMAAVSVATGTFVGLVANFLLQRDLFRIGGMRI
ncbi:Gx transporter family protein [Filifactor villosus]|uniref:Gx transporter family protein n=1 Tax=Filifactor villosus TaxID=29374 RepID=A0ABV9QMV6_9FIRM